MQQVIVLGDIELGAGNLTDDFISDNALSKLIRQLARRKNPIDLILNGDTFDFLKCPIIENGVQSFPRHITSEISLAKLDLVLKAHGKVFAALKEFLRVKSHAIYFIIGNHDHDLFFTAVQAKLKKILDRSKVHFSLKYCNYNMQVEHGHQYDKSTIIHRKNIFRKHRGKKVLHFPWASFAIMSYLTPLKLETPFIDRIFPRPALFRQHKVALHKIVWHCSLYFIRSLFWYPIRYWNDPTYFVPKYIFNEFYQRLKRAHWDVDSVVDLFKKHAKKKLGKYKLYIFGHIHERYLEEKDGWTILHPDSWRDEYVLDEVARTLHHKDKHYVEVCIKDGNPQWKVHKIKIKRSVFNIDDVIKDELTFVQKAAKEEGFKLQYTMATLGPATK